MNFTNSSSTFGFGAAMQKPLTGKRLSAFSIFHVLFCEKAVRQTVKNRIVEIVFIQLNYLFV
jgi:hypothetical protein